MASNFSPSSPSTACLSTSHNAPPVTPAPLKPHGVTVGEGLAPPVAPTPLKPHVCPSRTSLYPQPSSGGDPTPFTLTENLQQQEKVDAALSFLMKTVVAVGIPPENDSHSGPFSASQLLALHESGCPLNHMPARPVMVPALSDPETRQAMSDALLSSLTAALSGNLPAVQAGLDQAGQLGANALKNYITSGGHLAPNAPITLSGGWMRNRKSGKPVHISGKSGALPLYDTGQLVAAFGYKIKDK